jgi:hypothetical protein
MGTMLILSVPCRNHHVGFAEPDAIGSECHCLHAGRTKTIDGHTRNGVRKAGEQKADAGHIHTLFRFGHGATDNDVVYNAGINPRALVHNRFEDMREHVVRAYGLEHAARRFADRRSRRRYDISILHLPTHDFSEVSAFWNPAVRIKS